MLSFIRRKLSESDSGSSSNTTLLNVSTARTVDNMLAQKTTQMSLGNEAIPIGEDALLQELGYKNANDLQETVYGKHFAQYLVFNFAQENFYTEYCRCPSDNKRP